MCESRRGWSKEVTDYANEENKRLREWNRFVIHERIRLSSAKELDRVRRRIRARRTKA